MLSAATLNCALATPTPRQSRRATTSSPCAHRLVARAPPSRASRLVARAADTETVLLTYGSIGLVVTSIGWFAYRAFGSMMFGPSASASHILVKDAASAQALKDEIDRDVAGGAPLRAKFAQLATKHSTCPSSKKGGDLGTFKPGQMVKEFNDVVFSAPIDVVQGPIDTQFGSHLILITAREDDE
jgi:peptidyl-prolyl cis-trans isomerase C